MKVFLSFACVLLSLAVVYADDEEFIKAVSEFKEFLEQESSECFAEAGVTPGDLDKLKGIKEEDLEKAEIKELIEKFGCLMACTHKKFGTMKDSQLDIDEINIKIDEDLANDGEDKRALMKKISAECVQEVQGLKDECEIGGIFTICTFKKLKA